MSDELRQGAVGDHGVSSAERLAANHPSIAAVLARLETLDDLSLDEHVAVFEHAHEQLRRALDATPVDAAARS